MGYGLARASQGNSTSNRYGDSRTHGGTQQPHDIISQQPVPTVPAPTLGGEAVALAQAPALEENEASKAKTLLKLLPYNGEHSLETFLAKFEQMAKYLKWNNSDRFHHLCASLEGAAGQVLWGLKSDATAESVISLLRARFGNELQVEPFRAELRARRRRRVESLQSLYLDITGMVALAHPTSVPDLTQHVAKEAFVNSLGDDRLQIRVMDKQSSTIEEALGIAGRLEAYESTLKAQ